MRSGGVEIVMEKKQNKSFMYGAVVLLIANVLVKLIGAGFKIPLTYLLDEDGMGLFSTAYTIYTFLFVIATAGLPVAISKMIAESSALGRRRETKRIFHASFALLAFIGIAGSIALYFGADRFAKIAKSPMAVPAIKAIAPAMLFVSFMSAFRGYFQGRQDMVPTASSEVAEALFKLIVGYVLAYIFVGRGVEYGAAGAMLGVSSGAAAGLVVLMIMYIAKRKKADFAETDSECRSFGGILKKMFIIALPITIGASVFSLTTVIDTFMIQRRLLAAGFSASEALKLWGSYSGYAVPLFNLVPTLVTSISISIVPAVAGAYVKGEKDEARRQTVSAIKVTMLFALPCAVGIALLSNPILKFVYNNTNATSMLSILGYAVVFVSLVLVTNAVLQALGKVWLPVIHMAVGGASKVLINYVLVGMPFFNINGAPIGTNICYIIILLLNVISIIKLLGGRYNVSELVVKPLLSVAVMGVTVLFAASVSMRLGRICGCVLPIVAGGIAYAVMVFAISAVNKDDILMLPGGGKIYGILKKCKIMK